MAIGGLAACEPHTVEVRFAPEPGDVLAYRSVVRTTTESSLGGDDADATELSVLETTQSVRDVEDDAIVVDIAVRQDGAPARAFEVRLDRAGRLSGIDLIEGVPTRALGLDVGPDLPPAVASPPPGPLEPGTRWTIREPVQVDGLPRPLLVTGRGRIASLGVEDGHEVAVAVVELSVPVRSVVPGPDGEVTLIGTQTSRSETAYDLADGAVRRDRTEVTGQVDVIVQPPAGVEAPPLRGELRYEVQTETSRT